MKLADKHKLLSNMLQKNKLNLDLQLVVSLALDILLGCHLKYQYPALKGNVR